MSGSTTYKLKTWEAQDGWYWSIVSYQGRAIVTAPNSFTSKATALYAAKRAIETIRGSKIEDVAGRGSSKYLGGRLI